MDIRNLNIVIDADGGVFNNNENYHDDGMSQLDYRVVGSSDCSVVDYNNYKRSMNSFIDQTQLNQEEVGGKIYGDGGSNLNFGLINRLHHCSMEEYFPDELIQRESIKSNLSNKKNVGFPVYDHGDKSVLTIDEEIHDETVGTADTNINNKIDNSNNEIYANDELIKLTRIIGKDDNAGGSEDDNRENMFSRNSEFIGDQDDRLSRNQLIYNLSSRNDHRSHVDLFKSIPTINDRLIGMSKLMDKIEKSDEMDSLEVIEEMEMLGGWLNDEPGENWKSEEELLAMDLFDNRGKLKSRLSDDIGKAKQSELNIKIAIGSALLALSGMSQVGYEFKGIGGEEKDKRLVWNRSRRWEWFKSYKIEKDSKEINDKESIKEDFLLNVLSDVMLLADKRISGDGPDRERFDALKEMIKTGTIPVVLEKME